ncbi:hypothetical protein NXW50_05290 [Bacteroides thetaiotaomicron]|nr:hypothetical protein [Bacteroides thetaiotaomicron]MCS2277652.1 hypothetical protein [Bacteroides thetaiotaomicron]
MLTFNEPGQPEDPICKLTPDYMELLDFLSAKARNAEQLKPAHTDDSAAGPAFGSNWSNSTSPDETNILVVIGDKGFNSEWADSTLVNKLVKNNCRMIGFQLYEENRITSTTSCCKSGNMIGCSASRISRKNRNDCISRTNQK